VPSILLASTTSIAGAGPMHDRAMPTLCSRAPGLLCCKNVCARAFAPSIDLPIVQHEDLCLLRLGGYELETFANRKAIVNGAQMLGSYNWRFAFTHPFEPFPGYPPQLHREYHRLACSQATTAAYAIHPTIQQLPSTSAFGGFLKIYISHLGRGKFPSS
jgi:hypothetical protein